ncbi:MAG: hypothetical protein AVDCRST_MAG50-1877 [uncultured Acidimicrobiales bacterium]|uniref:Pyridoxamine 5'-phosphate oxidase N-terminal domain-containing protein n=1 Tax=uncultured Acidimicrobiales bacterium TaxID=310071 RepID=A0A6J4I958_9ACTN|nr:MAG: hypothetical protein AVDCRST_MAG50-1877 [uncultured Acidimicrobiales bacterium]
MIELTEEMRTRLSSALKDGYPVIAASVEPNGAPKLSFYGSTHVHGADSLAIWVRNPESGILDRLQANPHMSFLYRNPAERLRWVFDGRARVVDDPQEAAAIYDAIPDFEKTTDPERKGRAVVIDLDKVSGRDLLMER